MVLVSPPLAVHCDPCAPPTPSSGIPPPPPPPALAVTLPLNLVTVPADPLVVVQPWQLPRPPPPPPAHLTVTTIDENPEGTVQEWVHAVVQVCVVGAGERDAEQPMSFPPFDQRHVHGVEPPAEGNAGRVGFGVPGAQNVSVPYQEAEFA